MCVAGFLRLNDSRGERSLGLIGLAHPRQELPELKISGDVAGMRGEELTELAAGRGGVAVFGALEREAIPSERVIRFCLHKLFQDFAARLRRLSHNCQAFIIAGAAWRTKRRSADGKGMAQKPNHAQAKKNSSRCAASNAAGKTVSASQSEVTEVVLPNDTNPLGYILGGRVMHLVDIAGAIAAHRHSCSHVVTASVDYVDFRNPIRVGDLIVLKSSVNRVFNTSMEIGVKVFSENVLTGERRHTSSAYLTFVAVDTNLNRHPIPPLILETDDDRRRFRDAGDRRKIRLAHRYRGAPVSN